jgi:drug/metabolite transporter (DMT)-like permease
MSFQRLVIITLLSLLAFAANSIITRMALEQTTIDEASFITLRIVSGAIFLWLFLRFKNHQSSPKKNINTHNISKHNIANQGISKQGSWLAALSLFAYAISFTYGYSLIAAGTGALLLFGTVQITMTIIGYRAGERLNLFQISGFILAIIGLVILMLPGLEAPSLSGAILMCISGIAWSVYSHQGKDAANPSSATAGNFIKAAPMAILLLLFNYTAISLDTLGVTYALLSGIVTSGMGYILWYSVLPHLKSTQAAILQLSVPVIVTISGALLLNENITLRIVIASISILAGTLLVLLYKQSPSLKDLTQNSIQK